MESRRKEGLTLILSNTFEVLMSREINRRVHSRRKMEKNRRMILKEEKLKEGKKEERKEKKEKEKVVEIRKTEGEKLLRKIMAKIGLKQEDNEKGIVMEALLDSRTIGLVMSLEFTRKNKFKKKLDKPIYMKNVDGIFNYEGLIKHIVKVELFYKGHKERMEIDVIKKQKLNVILGIPWLVCHNPEID